MAKISCICYASCFVGSILVNIFFLTTHFDAGSRRNKLNWSKSAAEEAEFVASINCSGHGRSFLDGVVVSGKPICECYTCFHGSDCSEFSPDCVADAVNGDPIFLEPFWMQRASSSALVVSGWHRMSYSFASQRSETLQELEKCVRKIHSIAKNAITDGKYIVFGAGSTQLILAAVYALSFRNSSFPAQVFASAPNYPLYKMQLDYFKTDNFEFEGDTSMLKNNSDALNVIEFVTSPNNPDGKLKNSVLLGPSVSTIYDRAYYWPHYTAIPAPADEDVMMFTISKLTGHAGSRFGWAIVKDKSLYERMLEYIEMSELDLAKETALRALKLLQVITSDNGRQIFDFAYNTMRNRWEKLSHVISLSNRFSLQDISPQYCNFFNNVRGPSPAYAWLKCEREEDRDCIAIFKAAKINVNSGKKYNAETHFVRLSLLQAEDDFSWLLHRLNQLIKNEVAAAAAM